MSSPTYTTWDEDGTLVVRYPPGTVLTEPVAQAQMAAWQERIGSAPGKAVLILADVDGLGHADLAYRRAMNGYFRTLRGRVAVAVVGGNPYTRTLGKLLALAAPFPLRFCSSEDEARGWLRVERLRLTAEVAA